MTGKARDKEEDYIAPIGITMFYEYLLIHSWLS